MRFLKRILVGVLIYAAVYLPFVAILQSISGGDFTAAYAVGGASASVELILCAVIKREEEKAKKSEKAGGERIENRLETQADEP